MRTNNNNIFAVLFISAIIVTISYFADEITAKTTHSDYVTIQDKYSESYEYFYSYYVCVSFENNDSCFEIKVNKSDFYNLRVNREYRIIIRKGGVFGFKYYKLIL